MKRLNRSVICLFLICAACGVQKDSKQKKDTLHPKTGFWHCSLSVTNEYLPFDLEFISPFEAIIRNGDEEIKVSDISYHSDSIFIKLPLFDSEIKGLISNSDKFSGYWYNYSKGKDYKIALSAEYGKQKRFEFGEPALLSQENRYHGQKWEVTFSPGTKNEYKAIGVFEIRGDSSLIGTFITETGDYRYLEGNLKNRGFALSGFDGSHAFLFDANYQNDSLIGNFYSGIHWSEPWVAVQNPDFKLTDPYSLTYIKEGYDGLRFEFPDLDSNIVSYPDDTIFNDKVVVVQIMGSWCPNCMDETRLLTDLHNKYNELGLKVVSLCFEKPSVFSDAVKNIIRHKSYFSSSHTFLYAGSATKNCANKELPMLNHIMSFPTSIFIDRQGTIRKIHTGFYGPGTGKYYSNTVSEFESLIVSLLEE